MPRRPRRACRRDGVAFHRAAGEGTAPALEAHRGKDRRDAVFFGGQDGGFQLVQVGHRLQKTRSAPTAAPARMTWAKLGIGILKAQGACGEPAAHPGADVSATSAPVVSAALRAQAMDAVTTSSTVWPQPASFLHWHQRCLPAGYQPRRWHSRCGWPSVRQAFPARPARVSAWLQTACL